MKFGILFLIMLVLVSPILSLEASPPTQTDFQPYELIHEWENWYYSILDVQWSPDGHMLAFNLTSRVYILDDNFQELAHWYIELTADTTITVQWSPNSHYLAINYFPGNLSIWTPNGELIQTFTQAGSFGYVQWSPENTQILHGDRTGNHYLTNLSTGNSNQVALEGDVIAWREEGIYLVNDKHLYLVNPVNLEYQLLVELSDYRGQDSIKISPSGKKVAYRVESAYIVQDIQALTIAEIPFERYMNDFAWMPDEQALVLCNYDIGIVIQRIEDQGIEARLPNVKCASVVSHPQQNLLVFSNMHDIQTWQFDEDVVNWVRYGASIAITYVSYPTTGQYIDWNYDSTLLAVTSWHGFSLWTSETWRRAQHHYVDGDDGVPWVEFHPHKNELLVGIANLNRPGFTGLRWDIDTQKQIVSYPLEDDWMRWSPDGTKIAAQSALASDVVNIWDVETNVVLHTLSTPPQPLNALWSPDGKYILIAGGYESLYASLWNVETATRVDVYEASSTRIEWSPNGKYFVTQMGKWTQIRVASTGMAVINLPTGGAMDWNPAKNILVVAERTTLKFFDTQTGQLLQTISAHDKDIVDIAWSPDGRYLATVALDGTMKVWGHSK